MRYAGRVGIPIPRTKAPTMATRSAENRCEVWAVLEWECVIKSPQQGAIEGVSFIKNHIIETTSKRFDDFAGGDGDKDENQLKNILGI